MQTAVTDKKTTVKFREFSISIHLDGENFIVRKSEIIAGIRVPLDETYVLSLKDAIWMQNFWFCQLHGFSIN